MYVDSIGKNHYVIHEKDGEYLQSYTSIIAKRVNGKIFLDTNTWDFSKTTGKYRNIFLQETKEETQKKISSGEYILISLNERN